MSKTEWYGRYLTIKVTVLILWRGAPLAFLGLLSVLVGAAALPFYRNQVVGQFVAEFGQHNLTGGLLSVMAFVLLTQLVGEFRRGRTEWSEAALLRAMTPFFAQIRSDRGVRSFDEKSEANRMIEDASDAIFWLRIFFKPMMNVIAGGCAVVFGLTFIYTLLPAAALLLLPLIVLMVVFQGAVSVKLAALRRSQETARAEATVLQQLFSKRRDYEAMVMVGLKHRLLQKLSHYADVLYGAQQAFIGSRIWMVQMMWVIVVGLLFGVLYWSLGNNPDFTQKQAVTLIFNLVSLLVEVNLLTQFLGETYEQTERLSAVARAVLGLELGGVSKTTRLRHEPQHSGLDVRGLTWGYHPGQLLYRDVSFSVPPGTVTWIQGKNGTGKTTLVTDLLFNLVDVPPRTIFVGGVDVVDLGEEGVGRYALGVGQDTLYLPFTIPEMFRLIAAKHNAEYDEAQVWRSLEAVNLAGDLRSKPDQLESVIHRFHRRDESGKTTKKLIDLSGGMKRKLYLALFLYELSLQGRGDRMLLVLDEPFSSVDHESKLLVMKYLRSVGATVVIVTHETSLIEDHDRILFFYREDFEEGQVTRVRTGIFSELREQDVDYRAAVGV